MKKQKQINRDIGENLQAERLKAGLTQEVLAEMIGIGTKSLSAIECGTAGISLSTLKKTCETLAISSDSLIFGDKEKSDVETITARLERLSPSQLHIVSNMIANLLEAFSLQDKQ